MFGKRHRFALALGTTGFALCAQPLPQPLDFHGYLRTGVGNAQSGGTQVAFQLPGVPTKYRLGNEVESYGEFELDARIPTATKDGLYFNLTTMATFAKAYQSNNEASSSNVDLSQYWIEAGNVFTGETFGKSRIWAGNRYYRRRNCDMTDFWFWNDSGMGYGIEDVDLGASKFHFSAVSHRVPESMMPGTVMVGLKSQEDGAKSRISMWDYDLRLTDIKVNSGGELRFSAMFIRPHVPEDLGESPYNNGGYALMVKHAQADLWGGNNEVALQYGRGAGGANLAFGSYSSNSYDSASIPDISADMSHKAWRVLDVLTVHPWECWDAQMLVMHTEASKASAVGDGTDRDVWTSAGMRPTYHFTDHLALAYEIGYDRITHSYDSLTPALLKQTLAFEVINGRKYDSRPALRFFLTHARWNDDARVMADTMVAAGLDPTSGIYTLSSKGAFNTHNQGTTFGVQVEAWW